MISIVDDDLSVRESTKELVESLGYEALTFASARNFWNRNGSAIPAVSSPTCK
jgi:FixJ family two-component response regulator